MEGKQNDAKQSLVSSFDKVNADETRTAMQKVTIHCSKSKSKRVVLRKDDTSKALRAVGRKLKTVVNMV